MPPTTEVDTAQELRDADAALRAATWADRAAREAWNAACDALHAAGIRHRDAIEAHVKATLAATGGEGMDNDVKPGIQAGTRIGG